MISAVIDSLVSAFSPEAGLRRAAARQAMEQLKERRSYDGGKWDRTTKPWGANSESGDSPNLGEIQRIRYRAWDLYRNNVYARKAVRGMVAQTIGCGLKPESLATRPNGDMYGDFRSLAKTLWEAWGREASFSDNLTWGQLACLAFTEVILSGEVFIRRRREPAASKRVVPYSIELIPAERVVEDATLPVARSKEQNTVLYRGIEFDSVTGRRLAYYVYDYHPQDPRQWLNRVQYTRVPAEDIIHLYWKDRPDQQRGVSWFAPIVLQLRDIKDYQENELMAAAVGACVVAAITRQSGSSSGLGLATPSSQDSTDSDGNRIARLQPGMLLDLRQGESITGFNPQRPNSSAEGFISHMLRGVSAGLPGLKSSTITGDYRASSFSSEKSADNDAWREIEQLQEWLASSLCQPIWEDVLEAGFLGGWFDALDWRSFGENAWETNRRRYLAATWNGPVAKSINPADDERASQLAILLGTSSLPVECAARGLNWLELMEDQKRVMEARQKLGLPDPDAQKSELLASQIDAEQTKQKLAVMQAQAAMQSSPMRVVG